MQTALLSLAVLTVLKGSGMACFEKDLKRRLAYSTISQISYILCGLFLLTPQGLTGGLLHFSFHAGAKLLLFLSAGSLILRTGSRQVDALHGIGRKMPVTMACFSVGALALIGVPPLFGFLSKWSWSRAAISSCRPCFLFSYRPPAGQRLPDGRIPAASCRQRLFPGQWFRVPAAGGRRRPPAGGSAYCPGVLTSVLDSCPAAC